MQSTIQIAEAAHRKGELEEARQGYNDLLQRNENDADALYGLGMLSLQENDPFGALTWLNRASIIQPQAADIAFALARCLKKIGDAHKAITEALRSLEYCGTDEPLSRAVCQLLLELNQPKAVLNQLAQFPHTEIASAILEAQTRGSLGQWDESVSLLRNLFRDHHDEPKIARELSVAAGKLRDYPLAIDSFKGYLELTKPTAHDYIRFADLYLMARDVGNSQKQLDIAEGLGECGLEYLVLRARLARLSADNDVARMASEAVLKLQPNHGQAWSIRIETAEQRELVGLIERINKETDHKNTSIYFKSLIQYALADAYSRLGQLEEAFSAYGSANKFQWDILEARHRQYDSRKSELQSSSTIEYFSKVFVQARVVPGHPIPLFILGMPRSGTTLVERMLSQLDDVVAGGENETLSFLATQYQLDANSKRNPLPELMTASQWQAIAQRYHQQTNAILAATLAVPLSESKPKFLTDKMPQNFNHVGMILSMFPSAKIIQMRRDPRDVCLSIYTRSFPDGHSYACNFDALAHAYKLSSQLMDHWVRIAPDRVLDVHYEKLVEDPLLEGKKITAFCDLDWSDRCLEFHKSITSSFTFSEIQVRKAINSEGVGRWRRVEAYLQPLITALQQQGCLTGDRAF